MDDHLGYTKHDPAGRDGGNSRNGTRSKQLLAEIGPVEVAVRGTATAASSRRGGDITASVTIHRRGTADATARRAAWAA